MPERFYSKISTYICMSRSEGTPNPVLEALSCGRTIITTRVGITDAVVTPGVNGVFVDRNVSALVSAINEVKSWNKPLLVPDLGQYTWDAAAARWQQAMQMALDTKDSPCASLSLFEPRPNLGGHSRVIVKPPVQLARSRAAQEAEKPDVAPGNGLAVVSSEKHAESYGRIIAAWLSGEDPKIKSGFSVGCKSDFTAKILEKNGFKMSYGSVPQKEFGFGIVFSVLNSYAANPSKWREGFSVFRDCVKATPILFIVAPEVGDPDYVDRVSFFNWILHARAEGDFFEIPSTGLAPPVYAWRRVKWPK
jgi:hypothetical protein